jgi:tripartite-type tricarboxylate transporter receptor subunit TctC
VQLVLPFSAGSGSDLISRVFAEGLGNALGQPFVVNNRAGAGGTIAAGAVARAEPDGQTLSVIGMGHLANGALYKNLPYDPIKDFAAISPLGTFPNLLIVPSASSIKSAAQLIDLARSKPGKLDYATAGVGSAAHINMQMLIAATGIEAEHIPMKGAAEIVTEVAAGRSAFAWAPLSAALGMVKTGKVVALAISSKSRSKLLSEIPTIAEAGFPAAECNVWVGLLAPAKTPAEILMTLSHHIRKLAESPALQAKLVTAGAEPLPMTPPEFEALMRRDYVVLDRLMRKTS